MPPLRKFRKKLSQLPYTFHLQNPDFDLKRALSSKSEKQKKNKKQTNETMIYAFIKITLLHLYDLKQ